MSNMGGLSELRHIRGTSRSFSGSYMMLNVTVTYKLIHKYHTIWFINKELNPPPQKKNSNNMYNASYCFIFL